MLNVNDIVSKDGVQLKVSAFEEDFDMLTGNPYRVAILVDSSDKFVSAVAENVVLTNYKVNQINDMKITPVSVAVFYDNIGGEYMEYIITNESEINVIMNDYNKTGEYDLNFRNTYIDYEYSGLHEASL